MSAKRVSLRSNVTVLVLFLVATNEVSTFTPRVETKFGQIQGKWSRSSRGRPIANYLGIPYAQPPLGDLRFRSPEPWNGTWSKPYDGTRDGPMCLQQNVKGNVAGKEDCLYLNVFVPLISGKRDAIGKLPVMVYVHGGAFNTGSSDSRKFAATYLLDQRIVLVTLNYRLDALGFFSTANRVSPGNYGLKDILMALKWVHENIASFQGDPDSVTLFGQSAGAAAVHHLALSNRTEGLFHRYILHSGSALATFALHTHKNIRRASLEMARLLGCLPHEEVVDDEVEVTTESTDNSTISGKCDTPDDEGHDEEDDETMMTCMRNVDARRIFRVNGYCRVWKLNPYCIFGPTMEGESEDAVITVHPLAAIKNHLFRDIPWIIGVVEHEGLLKSIGFITDLKAEDEMITHFETYLPYLTEYHERITNATVFAEAIKDFYFDGNLTTRFSRNMTEMIGDAIITWPAYRALKYQSEAMNSSTYFFRFSYEGTFSNTFSSGIPIHYGVSHGDDMNYLFPMLNNMYPEQMLHNTEDDLTMINVMTEMWTSFATDGLPRAWRIPHWPNYQDTQEYLRIGLGRSPDVLVENDFLPERMTFWEELTANVTEDTMELDPIMGTPAAYDEYDTGGASQTNKSLTCLLLLLVYFFRH